MRYMNDYDIIRQRRQALGVRAANRLILIDTVDNLRRWADRNSDGWAYWPKPRRAAQRAILEIEGDGTSAAFTRYSDTSDADLAAALRPIKAFLTRQGVDHSQVIATRRDMGSPFEVVGYAVAARP